MTSSSNMSQWAKHYKEKRLGDLLGGHPVSERQRKKPFNSIPTWVSRFNFNLCLFIRCQKEVERVGFESFFFVEKSLFFFCLGEKLQSSGKIQRENIKNRRETEVIVSVSTKNNRFIHYQ